LEQVELECLLLITLLVAVQILNLHQQLQQSVEDILVALADLTSTKTALTEVLEEDVQEDTHLEMEHLVKEIMVLVHLLVLMQAEVAVQVEQVLLAATLNYLTVELEQVHFRLGVLLHLVVKM
jgi:uncharacterized protein (DUF39 family)